MEGPGLFRTTIRALSHQKTFTLAAILTVVIGIGPTTAVFGVVDRILFQGLPYSDSGNLVTVGMVSPSLPYDFIFGADFLRIRENHTLFESTTSWKGMVDCDLSITAP